MTVQEIKKVVEEKADKTNSEINLNVQDLIFMANMKDKDSREILKAKNYNLMEVSIKLSRVLKDKLVFKKCYEVATKNGATSDEAANLLCGVIMYSTQRDSEDYIYAVEKVREINSVGNKPKVKNK